MHARLTRTLAAVVTATLGASAMAAWSASATTADPVTTATQRLRGDADGPLTLRTDHGAVSFIGVPAGVRVTTPGVTRGTSVSAAAQAVVDRYGAALGAVRPGTDLVVDRTHASVAGDVVRYQQRVGGLPVLGGDVAVSLGDDRSLTSVLSHVSAATKVGPASISERTAEATAQQSFQRSAGEGPAATVRAVGRWVVDPALIGASADLPVRTAWRFELTRGVAERRLVLVDDQTGLVLMNNDLVAEAKKRVVCDNNSVLQNPGLAAAACVNASANLVRTETGPAAALAEANTAFDLAGVMHDNYATFGGLDLTDLIGREVGDGKALAQTVRWCFSGYACPYANAFWNGFQMYYGEGYAGADDVVGHEMTHGVTERTSNLMYWGQSGAINESISDILGEIIDHRNVAAGETPTNWALGEDLPGYPTGIRNVQDPTLMGDPDKTSSTFYVKQGTCGGCYPDNDGVHTNSGVGNHTFYLASQGGTFNGQTITGIDAGDDTLTRSAKLWLLTDQTLTSGSDYADLAVVLEQACQSLIGAGVMTQANCDAVHQATLATELRATPVKNPQPADATMSCPAGSSVRVLFDSETDPPASKFVAGPGWGRDGTPGAGQDIAHSAPAAWSNDEAPTVGATSLTTASGIALPAGQASYLFFQQWRLLDYDTGGFYDAGTVEVDGAATAGLPWVNGPGQTIASGYGNPKAGQKGFGGDSRGYLASRLDLTSFAGQSVTPQFTMNTDNTASGLGWFVDDIAVYTCDPSVEPPAPTPTPTPTPTPAPAPPAPADVAVKGRLGKAVVTWATPTTGASAVTAYRVFTTGITTDVAASVRKVTLTGLKQGSSYPITVVPIVAAGQPGTAVTVQLRGTSTRLVVRQADARTKLSGRLLAGSSGVVGARLKLLVKQGTTWVKVATTRTGTGGRYVVKVAGTKVRKYRSVYAGGPGLLGNRSPVRHR